MCTCTYMYPYTCACTRTLYMCACHVMVSSVLIGQCLPPQATTLLCVIECCLHMYMCVLLIHCMRGCQEVLTCIPTTAASQLCAIPTLYMFTYTYLVHVYMYVNMYIHVLCIIIVHVHVHVHACKHYRNVLILESGD